MNAAVVRALATGAAESLQPGTAIDPRDVNTWTFRTDRLPRGYVIYTSWSPTQFSPVAGLPGTPLHFETVVCNRGMDDFIGDSARYATEAEARDGHDVIVRRLRTHVEAA
jgi:hypothetical protein